jgi:hypothetical protein
MAREEAELRPVVKKNAGKRENGRPPPAGGRKETERGMEMDKGELIRRVARSAAVAIKKIKKRDPIGSLSGCRNNSKGASRPVPVMVGSKIKGLIVSSHGLLLI